MLTKYNRINHVRFKEMHEGDEYVGHFLMAEKDDDLGFSKNMSIELDVDLWFSNEFEVLEVLNSTPVKTLRDVLSYCYRNDIEIEEERMKEGYLIASIMVEGENFIITSNLGGDWEYNLGTFR